MSLVLNENLRGLRHYGVTAELMGVIDANCVRYGERQNGYFDGALFELAGECYKMDEKGVLYISIADEWEECPSFKCKSGIYSEYQIGRIRIKTYHMTLLCLTDWFYAMYMTSSSFVVNHMKVEKLDSSRKINFITTHACLNPDELTMRDPKYLEVVSSGLNTRHGSFILNYGLYNMRISAFDVEALRCEIDKESKRRDDSTPYCEYDAVREYSERTKHSDTQTMFETRVKSKGVLVTSLATT